MKKLVLILSMLLVSHCLQAQLSGTKTVSAANGDYLTLQAAINDLNTQGVGTGGVTFLVADGETFNVNNATDSLVVTATGTVDNPIVFKQSADGVKPVVNVTGVASVTDNSVIKLSGSDFVKLEGLDFRGDISTEYGVFVSSPAAANGCRSNIIQNCAITLDKTNTNPTYGVYLYAGTPVVPEGANKYNKFYNNTVQNCTYGYNFDNHNATVTNFDEENDVGAINNGTSIVNNTALCGIYLYGQMNCKVYKNKISNIAKLDATTSAPAAIGAASANPSANLTGTFEIYNNEISGVHSSTSSSYGVYFSQRKTLLNFYNNRISDVLTTSAESDAASGITMVATALTGNVYNNLIYDIQAPSAGSATSANPAPSVKGIDCRTGTAFNVYYNTVYLKFDVINPVNRSVCVYHGSMPCDFRNNIFVNLSTLPSDATNGFAASYFKNSNNATSYSQISATTDFNLHYAGIPQGNNQHLIFHALPATGTTAVNIETLAAYKTLLNPREQNSISQLPPFVSTTAGSYDFKLSSQLPVYAQPITAPLAITTDINGTLRHATNPTIGAYEYDASDIQNSVTNKQRTLTSYPNPFNNKTVINYTMVSAGLVKISVFNAQGQIVRELFSGMQSAGQQTLSFDATGLNSGVYYCKLESAGQNRVAKLLLIK